MVLKIIVSITNLEAILIRIIGLFCYSDCSTPKVDRSQSLFYFVPHMNLTAKQAQLPPM